MSVFLTNSQEIGRPFGPLDGEDPMILQPPGPAVILEPLGPAVILEPPGTAVSLESLGQSGFGF